MPPKGTAGLARSRVSGSRRDPLPPAKTMVNTSRCTRKPPHDARQQNQENEWHRRPPSIVHRNESQANGSTRVTAGGAGGDSSTVVDEGAFWGKTRRSARALDFTELGRRAVSLFTIPW